MVANVDDYNFYRENVNLIKGVSRIWNTSIHLMESMNSENSNETTITRNDTARILGNSNVYTACYKHKDDCLLLISVMVNNNNSYYVTFKDEYQDEKTLMYINKKSIYVCIRL